MRILDKYLYKELFATFFAVLAVLLLITFGTEATKVLAIAVEGKIPPSAVFQALLYKIPPALEVILPLVALLSVMLAIGRLYQDQEMVVLSSCGIPSRYFQKRIFWFLLPLALLTAWITLYVTPWSFKQDRMLITEAQTTSPLAALTPGKFNELPNGEGVFYAKSISETKEMHSVWVRLFNPDQDVLLMAPTGKFEWINGKLALVLLNGHSYEGLEKGENLTVRDFKRFEGYLPEIQVSAPSRGKYEVTTLELWHSDKVPDKSLLQWRLLTPLSIIVLGLLGLKMSKSGPREGRFAKIFFALVLYVIFNQLLVTTRDAIDHGNFPVQIGLWPVLLIFLFYALYPGKLMPKWFVLPTVSLSSKFRAAKTETTKGSAS
ncbi:MAG: LPS export ABC transporter permease LptF [Hydrogenovibrio sp.]|nr:LPS export ABC transporter permease LptF [Hydrogenovibrio sp.]